jgi:hypothetical protein
MTRTKKAPDDPMQMALGDADPTARARTGAPATSRAAAASLTLGNMRASQMRVLQLFTAYGDMDDRALLRVAKAEGVKMSDSGLRSRRSELAKPNMDRIDGLMAEWMKERRYWRFRDGWFRLAPNNTTTVASPDRDASGPGAYATTAELKACEEWARRTLRIEGFRSPLWDTGRRVEYEGGRQGIVWGKVPQGR